MAQQPKISKERGDELACFNGVGGSGTESEFSPLIAPIMVKMAAETDILKVIEPQIQRLASGEEIACFNGVGGSGREAFKTPDTNK